VPTEVWSGGYRFARPAARAVRGPKGCAGRVFGGPPAVDGWHQDGPVAYVLAISDPAVAAPAVTRALVQAGADVPSIGESHHALEDVYLELIGENETVRSAPLRVRQRGQHVATDSVPQRVRVPLANTDDYQR
jgi:hypothetical protein